MTAAEVRKRPIPFVVALLLIVGLPFLGKGGILASALIACAVLGAPLFVLIGVLTVMCFVLWADFADISQHGALVERIRTLADSPTLLAIPLFIMSGTVMSKGQISARLIEFAKALVGWIPGGLAMSAVIACILFAAISGSSPATVVAIGSMMAPALIKDGYAERFSHGLLTSAGSLGILIPPSIPMILYPLVNQRSNVQVEHLFASGFGPGLVMGAILMGFSFYHGVRDRAPRTPFSLRNLGRAALEGFWALMFPILILGGIYSGLFNAIEASAVSVVYAVIVEVYVHRALRLGDVPRIFQETGVFLGTLLVIMIAALTFSEFLELQGIPAQMVRFIRSLDLEPWQFLVALNLLLLIVGMAMDILSAMFIFVPLLAPVALAMGVDPMHFGIIFIVNLEIGYLTPPVGLNLFVASTLFERPIGHMIKAVGPFIALMLIGLGVVTYVPEVSVGLGRWIMDVEAPAEIEAPHFLEDEPQPLPDEPVGQDAGVQTIEEMMQELDQQDGGSTPSGSDHVQTIEEMMQELDQREAEPPPPEPDHVQTIEEMMRELDRQEATGMEQPGGR